MNRAVAPAFVAEVVVVVVLVVVVVVVVVVVAVVGVVVVAAVVIVFAVARGRNCWGMLSRYCRSWRTSKGS